MISPFYPPKTNIIQVETNVKNSTKMEPGFKLGIRLILSISFLFLLACTSAENGKPLKEELTDSISLLPNTKPPANLTLEQETALDALNSLQRQILQGRFYSTFPGMYHDCFPSDTSFIISQTELLGAVEVLFEKYNTDITSDRFKKLTQEAVSAQKEYVVKHCYGTSYQMIDGVFKNVTTTALKSGTWILPGVLGRRDVILAW